jgi:excisionase family DNA binding protein
MTMQPSASFAIPQQLLEQVADLIAERLAETMPVSVPSQFLTVEEAAEHLGCSVDHVRTLYRRGDVVAFRPGRRVLIDRGGLDEYVRSVPA